MAAFAPDEGETLGAAEANSKDSVLNSALVPRRYPTADGGSATEFYIDPAKARDAFAGDLSDEQAALIAATQRPVAEAAFSEPNGPPAWKNLPSWAVVATGDKAAGTDVVRSMAERAGATITEVEGSHVIMVSQPQAVTEVILEAVAAVTASPSLREDGRHDPRSAVVRHVSQIDAGPLNVGYVDAGPADGPAVVLLHGWPYDIHSYVEVAPLLTAAGYRVIVPYLRGYGTTRFLSDETLRNGEQVALAADTIALMDALGSRGRSSPASTGEREPPTSSLRCGPSVAAAWSR